MLKNGFLLMIVLFLPIQSYACPMSDGFDIQDYTDQWKAEISTNKK